jgi:hypothetical protein
MATRQDEEETGSDSDQDAEGGYEAIDDQSVDDEVQGMVVAVGTPPAGAAPGLKPRQAESWQERKNTPIQPFNANEDECRGGDFVFGLPPLWIPKGVTTALSARSAKARGIFEHIRMANAGGG